MKIVFMGTPDFAVPSLKALINEDYKIEAVVTQPDKPKGRGKKVVMTPVKEVAIENDIKVYQPAKIKKDEEVINALKEINPDVIVVIAYGQLLSREILDIPKYGCINVHGSILPEYRGASPIQTAILDGKTETGVTTQLMGLAMDTGDMLITNKMDILENDTAGTMHNKLAVLGANTLVDTLKNLKNITPIKQDDEKATYCKIIDKKFGLIDWSKPSSKIINLIRAFNPWPSAFTYYDDTLVKIWDAETYGMDKKNIDYGTIADVIDKEGIIIKTGDGFLLITELQVQGKKRMKTVDYLKGNKVEKGKKFGVKKVD